MSYPYERFLRFLVSRRLDPDRTLDRYGLPSVGNFWFAKTNTNLIEQGPYAIASYLKSKTGELVLRDGILEWAEKEGFRELWEFMPEFGELGNETLDEAFRIFINPEARAMAGMLCMARGTDTEICKAMTDGFHREISMDVLNMYRRIFWDTTNTTDDEWRELIEEFRTKNERTLIAQGVNGQSVNFARGALELPIAVDVHEMLREMLSYNYTQWQDAAISRNAEGVWMWQSAALKLVRELREGARAAASMDTGLPSTLDYENLFSVEISRTVHPTLAELQGEVSEKARSGKSEDGGA